MLSQKEHAVVEMFEWLSINLSIVNLKNVRANIEAKIDKEGHPDENDTYKAMLVFIDTIEEISKRETGD